MNEPTAGRVCSRCGWGLHGDICGKCGQPAEGRTPSRRITRADKALTEMYEHLTWLRERRSPVGHQWHESDVAREVGFTEAMDILRKHGARVVGKDIT